MWLKFNAKYKNSLIPKPGMGLLFQISNKDNVPILILFILANMELMHIIFCRG